MDSLVTFVKLLLFLETILLTPEPIHIGNDWISITPEHPIKAITGGAAIYIDVTKYIAPFDWDTSSEHFQEGVVQGRLIKLDGSEITLANSGTSHDNDFVWLIVDSEAPLPTNVEFVHIKLRSTKPIESALVYWKNGKH